MKKLKENLPSAFNRYILPNGLRIIHEPSASKVAYCGFAVDAGTRDELENEQGMAHFVEHLIFKGTAKRKAWHIPNRMENVGGDLNAYTNKEETMIYSAFLDRAFRPCLRTSDGYCIPLHFSATRDREGDRGDYRRDTILRRQSFRAHLR